ncbi:MAG: tail fiber domain-containing protein [Bacteroidota bacterium]
MKIYTLFRTTFTFFLVLSTYSITTAQSDCGKTIFDNGGPLGTYADATSQITTVCPDDPGAQNVSITFATYAVASGDVMSIYDGNSISEPLLATDSDGGTTPSDAPSSGVLLASSTNISGCLTIEFIPNGDGNSAQGYEIEVSCLNLPRFNLDGDARIDGRIDLASVGDGNLFIGRNAGISNDIGSGAPNGLNNTFIGFEAGKSNTLGYKNTFVGEGAGRSSSQAGFRNTFIGANAGEFETRNGAEIVGSRDISGVGSGARIIGDGIDNSSTIGSNSSITASHQAVLGNSATQSIRGTVNWTTVSDARYKTNVEEDVPGLAFIQQLRPVSYYLDVPALGKQLDEDQYAEKGEENPFAQYWKDKANVRYTGFIAQEVEAAAEELSFEFSGVDQPRSEVDIYGLRYGVFVVPLVKAVQEQQEVIEDLEEKVARLEGLVSSLIKESNVITEQVSSANLLQNAPNPFSDNTTIQYFIPESTQRAQLQVVNANGQIIKQIELSNVVGQGQVRLEANTLNAGNYRYQLIIDGRIVDSKQMVLTK